MSAKASTSIKLKPGVVTEVAIGQVKPDPDQPRKTFEEKALASLADNIRERGIQQPILVRNVGGSAGLMIVDGERRWRAAKLAKLKTVPALLVDGVELEQLRLDQVSVNQLREQLTTIELARVLRGLRDANKTTNEIAATMAKQGYPAVKPARIDELVALTDLPEWLQGMVERDEVEAGAAGELAQLIPLPGVEKKLQKWLARAVGYSGKLTGQSVRNAGRQVLEDVGADLRRSESWHSNPVLFNWKTRCKGCEHLVKWGREDAFCLNAKLFAEHQAEAKAAGLGPGGRLPEKPKAGKAAEKEAAQQEELRAALRERSLAEKVRDYLHGCLTVALVEAPDPGGHLQKSIVLWRALKNPGSDGSRGSNAIDAPIPPWARSLEQLTTGDEQLWINGMRAATLNILNEMPWRETHALARQVYPRLELAWKLDHAFLDLFRKAELVHMATTYGLALPEGRRSWDAMKGDEIKAAMLSQPEMLPRPAILADLYEGEIESPNEPYRGWEDDEDEEADDDLDDEEVDERDAA